jgi:hypothetical protein
MMMYIYTLKYYSTIKKDEILSFPGKWMELESIMLSEVTRFRKKKVTCFLSNMIDPNIIYICIYGGTVRGD